MVWEVLQPMDWISVVLVGIVACCAALVALGIVSDSEGVLQAANMEAEPSRRSTFSLSGGEAGATSRQAAAPESSRERMEVARPDCVSASVSHTSGDVDYEAVFPNDSVQRIDLVIAAEDWQAMLAEASTSSRGGAIGPRPDVDFADGNPQMPAGGDWLDANAAPDSEARPTTVPSLQAGPSAAMRQLGPAFADACAECQTDAELVVHADGRDISGICVESEDGLVFQPTGSVMDARQPPESGEDGIPIAADLRGAALANPEVPMWGEDQPGPQGELGRMQVGTDAADDDLTYVECAVAFKGELWEHVGIRFKGNSTLTSTIASDSWKYPLHLDFDEFEDIYPETKDQRFFGFDDLALSNAATDPSFLRDVVPAALFSGFGVPTPRAAYYQVYLDVGDGPTFLGLYTVVETPDDPMLHSQFGDDEGNLYKPRGAGATWAWSSFDEASFEKKSNRGEADWSDIEAAFEALHASREDPAGWRANLESLFDVDGFLRWLAVNQILGNWDAYGQMAQNYYLYVDPSDDLIHWIPWDHNMSWSAGMRMSRGGASIALDSVTDEWPLIRYLLDDPVYRAAYTTYVAEALETVFDPQVLETLIRATFETIEPFLTDPDGALSEYSFVSSVGEARSAMEQLVASAKSKIEEAATYLTNEGYEPVAIVLSEVHYNPASSQGEDSVYEFIELYNRGACAVDLSGYRFDHGIEFTFPEETSLAPGECLIVAADGSAYSGLACQVFEWTSGRLSNGGEVIRLVDAAGFRIDRIEYDDGSGWPAVADGDGHSLQLVDPATPNHLPSNWTASPSVGGSPGGI